MHSLRARSLNLLLGLSPTKLASSCHECAASVLITALLLFFIKIAIVALAAIKALLKIATPSSSGAPNDPSCEPSSAGTPLPAFDGTSEGGLDDGPMEADSPERSGHLPCTSSSSSSASSSHPQRQKRVRTSFKHHQLRTMKSYFAINHNPDAKDLKQLAEKTGLSKRVLQVSETCNHVVWNLIKIVFM